MEELGRALHYLQDVNVPHHSMNAVAILTNHIEFKNLEEENNACNSLGTIIDNYADTARGWYDEASSGVTREMKTAAGASVRNSQRSTVAVLYKF